MIRCEFHRKRNDGVNLFRTFSDAGFKIRKVGTEYIDKQAIDVEGAPYTYVETDVPIEQEGEKYDDTVQASQ